MDAPAERIGIPAPAACGCGTSLAEVDVVGVRRRQVHNLPEIPTLVVTEYRADVNCCPGCQAEVAGEFPAGVNAPAQYGLEISTRVTDVVIGHHVPVHRSTILVMGLLGMQVSTGFAASLRGRAAAQVREGGFFEAVKKLLATAPAVHADEPFARTAAGPAFMHVACAEHLTLMYTGDRSAATIDDGGVLPELSLWQVLIRDGSGGYTHLTNVLHAWCGAQLPKDLRGIHEVDPAGQLWAKAMADTLTEANRIASAVRAEGREELTPDELRTIDRLYSGALARARMDNPAGNTTVLAEHARALADRLETHRKVILRFTTNLAVSFTNNTAEHAVRPVKVQQRSPGGCWRTFQGLVDFAVVHSDLSTAAHWGITRFQALHPGPLQRPFSAGRDPLPDLWGTPSGARLAPQRGSRCSLKSLRGRYCDPHDDATGAQALRRTHLCRSRVRRLTLQ